MRILYFLLLYSALDDLFIVIAHCKVTDLNFGLPCRFFVLHFMSCFALTESLKKNNRTPRDFYQKVFTIHITNVNALFITKHNTVLGKEDTIAAISAFLTLFIQTTASIVYRPYIPVMDMHFQVCIYSRSCIYSFTGYI